jgi:catechol 2,3-dioxygenase-like lactoylglutathione lyase family enzyme
MERLWIALRNHLIGLGFKGWTWSVRAKRVLKSLGRPRLKGLEHITIAVTDLAVARRFYCDLLGGAHFMTVDDAMLARFGRPPAPDNGEGAHHVSVYLGGATRLDLFLQHAGQHAATLGHPHLAFEVSPGQLLAWNARLRAAGVPVDGPLQLGPPGQASLYFNDPFGNHLEIMCFGFRHAVVHRPPLTASLAWTQR